MRSRSFQASEPCFFLKWPSLQREMKIFATFRHWKSLIARATTAIKQQNQINRKMNTPILKPVGSESLQAPTKPIV